MQWLDAYDVNLTSALQASITKKGITNDNEVHHMIG
jgi:hypothetical protein